MSKQSKCDYSKGIIYKIKCRDRSIKDIYVGSTTNFASRKTQHKSVCNNPNSKTYNLCVYQFIREHGGWDNWDMIPIKTYSCNSHMELAIEEQSVIEELEEYTTLNRHMAWRSEEEHKRKQSEADKRFYHNNKEKRKKLREIWRKNNMEREAKRANIWYHNNKERVLEKIVCECGSEIGRNSLSRHRKTLKHKTWEAQPEPNLIFID